MRPYNYPFLGLINNSMVDDSIRLWLFPRTLIRNAAKWYIELPCTSVNTFGALVMEFLRNFQLPIYYETGTEILTSLRQNTATHIFDHIHEWRRRWSLVKAPLPDYLLADWFYKSLLPQIAKDVTFRGVVIEYKSIRHAQYLDLIYSQSRTLYDVIPNTPCNSNSPATQQPGAHVNGIIGATSRATVKQLSGHIVQLSVDPSTKSTSLPTTAIKFVQSTQKPGGKNKKNKKKIDPYEEQSTKQYNPNQRLVAPFVDGKDKPTYSLVKYVWKTT